MGRPGDTTLTAGQTTTFTVTLNTDAVWSGSEQISFANNDTSGGENPFTFVVSGSVTAMPPEITVLNGTTDITSGKTTPIDLGSAVHNAAGPSKTFTIRNDGDQTLTLTTPFASTAHFTVGQPGKTSLAAGESTSFTVTLNTGAVWSGSEQIAFGNNDADNGDGVENPFTFVVSGSVTQLPPEITVLDGTTNIASGQTTPIDLGSAVRNAAGPSQDVHHPQRRRSNPRLDGQLVCQHGALHGGAAGRYDPDGGTNDHLHRDVEHRMRSGRAARQISFANNDRNGEARIPLLSSSRAA